MEVETVPLKKIRRPEYAEFDGWSCQAVIDCVLRRMISDPLEIELLEVRTSKDRGKPTIQVFLRERVEHRFEERVEDALCNGTVEILAKGLLECLRSRPFGSPPTAAPWEVQFEIECILRETLSNIIGPSESAKIHRDLEESAVREYGLNSADKRAYEKHGLRPFGLIRFMNHRLRQVIAEKITSTRKATERARKVQ